jgi:hypothetical protein
MDGQNVFAEIENVENFYDTQLETRLRLENQGGRLCRDQSSSNWHSFSSSGNLNAPVSAAKFESTLKSKDAYARNFQMEKDDHCCRFSSICGEKNGLTTHTYCAATRSPIVKYSLEANDGEAFCPEHNVTYKTMKQKSLQEFQTHELQNEIGCLHASCFVYRAATMRNQDEVRSPLVSSSNNCYRMQEDEVETKIMNSAQNIKPRIDSRNELNLEISAAPIRTEIARRDHDIVVAANILLKIRGSLQITP